MTVAEYVPSCMVVLPPPAISWNESGGRFSPGPAGIVPNPKEKFALDFRHMPLFSARCAAPNFTLAFAGPHSISTLTPLNVPLRGQVAARCAEAGAATTATAAQHAATMAAPRICIDVRYSRSQAAGMVIQLSSR